MPSASGHESDHVRRDFTVESILAGVRIAPVGCEGGTHYRYLPCRHLQREQTSIEVETLRRLLGEFLASGSEPGGDVFFVDFVFERLIQVVAECRFAAAHSHEHIVDNLHLAFRVAERLDVADSLEAVTSEWHIHLVA